MAAEGKINATAVRRELLQVLQHDRDAQVRIEALYALWSGARQRPEVVAAVLATAQHDARTDVRQVARNLLAQR
jgi:formate-dependent nitrite reductase cytochrome c552 subunit